jgi:Fe-S-cluster containining protein
VHPVPVSYRDVARLVRVTGLAAEALVEWVRVDEVDFSGEPGSFALLDVGLRVMLLRREGDACMLLRQERCSVHAHSPAACRAYPLHASFGKNGGLRRLRVLRGVDCPLELDGSSRLHDVRSDQRRLRQELSLHQALLARWNRQQRRRRRFGRALAGVGELLAFLGLAQPPERAQDEPSMRRASGQHSSG